MAPWQVQHVLEAHLSQEVADKSFKTVPPQVTPTHEMHMYVVARDIGMAPCVQDGMLSLALCKPVIRSRAAVGDWLVGHPPKDASATDGAILYIALITSVMTPSEYHNHTGWDRGDQLYRTDTGTGKLVHRRNIKYHDNPDSYRRDMKGNVLLSTRYNRWHCVDPLKWNEFEGYQRRGDKTVTITSRQRQHLLNCIMQAYNGKYAKFMPCTT